MHKWYRKPKAESKTDNAGTPATSGTGNRTHAIYMTTDGDINGFYPHFQQFFSLTMCKNPNLSD